MTIDGGVYAMNVLFLLLFFLVFIMVGVPICYALGISSILFLMSTNPEFIAMVPQRIWAGTNIYVMIALPLFFLAGELIEFRRNN